MSEVGIQKFSFPFSCSPRRRQDEVAPLGLVQVKSLQLQENLVLSPTVVCHEAPQGDAAPARLPPCAEAPPPPPPHGHGALHSLAVEAEDQRPAAKRQLSSESAARTISVVKKSAVRKDAEERGPPGAQLGQKGAPCSALAAGSRRRRKDLFTNPDVFHRLDAHVVRAGAELREKRVYEVKAIVRSITQGARSELEKVRAIWVWLCHNIEYDVGGYLGRSEKLSSPEEVIAAGRGVCCGYSSLCSQMCREAGVQCQEVPGYSKGIGYRQGQSLRRVRSDHLWNAVLLGGQWFLLDACWGAGRVDMEHQSFVKSFDDFYFLTDPEEFIDSHFPDEERWQLLEAPISLEEFERRVFKTSAFFSLGLRLLRPPHCHLLTDDGEANVSLGFSRPVTFTHEITPQQDLGGGGGGSSSFGLLTVSPRSMRLQLLPPAVGTYHVKLFARPESAATPLLWVCSFLLECVAPRATEEIPDNPFLSWGLQPAAAALGVAGGGGGGGGRGSEVIRVEDGSFRLALKTSRPLMALCELVHPELDAAVAKRCLATQIQPDLLSCHALCPARGFYRLSVFVRDYERSEAKFQNAANFLLRCEGKVVGRQQLFPPDLGSCCGPGTRALEAGLSKFSHTTALVSAPQGRCNLTFHNQRDLELHATLSGGGEERGAAAPLARHLFCTYTDSKVTVSVSLPGAGVYRLGLYARTTAGGDFDPMCDFAVRNVCEQPAPPFPCVYAGWRKGCVLFEPRVGLLEPASWVRFRVRVPGAQRVSLLGQTRTDLKMNKSRVWEADAFSGDGLRPLKLAASSGESGDMAVLMTFDVKRLEREE